MVLDERLTRFLNVDLEIEPASDFDILLNEISTKIVVLHNTGALVSLELVEEVPTADDAIVRFAGLIAALSADAREIWRNCKRRSMNIGIQAGAEPHSAAFRLSAEAVAATAGVDCEIVVTVYARRG